MTFEIPGRLCSEQVKASTTIVLMVVASAAIWSALVVIGAIIF